MYFQFLIEDKSTEVLVNHVMNKMKGEHPEKEVIWDTKSFSGIGNLTKKGNAFEQKTGKLLNDLSMYMKGINKALLAMKNAVMIIVLDNDKRDILKFREELENLASSNMILCDHVFCIAIKEMEAWLLGDANAIREAYPAAKMQFLKKYDQDAICDTWEVLAEIVYPKGLNKLKQKANGSYTEIGKAKTEWANKIGKCLHIHENCSPSFQFFVNEVEKRVLT